MWQLLVCCLMLFATNGHAVDVFHDNLEFETMEKQPVSGLAPTKATKFQWERSNFPKCYGCGYNSYMEDQFTCVQVTPVKLVTDGEEREMIAKFKVSDTECNQRGVAKPPQFTSKICGPPCRNLRLLTDGFIGCICNQNQSTSYNPPRLKCQDNRNRTVDLALCQSLYKEQQQLQHLQPHGCNFAQACQSLAYWLPRDWSNCEDTSGTYQSRQIDCVVGFDQSTAVLVHPKRCQYAGIKPELKPENFRFCARWIVERKFRCNCNIGIARRRKACRRYDPQVQKHIFISDTECQWHPPPVVSRKCKVDEC